MTIDLHACCPRALDYAIDVVLAHTGMPLIDPRAAGFTIALDALAPAQVPAGADFQDGVIAGVEDEAEAAGVLFARGWRHDAGVEDGDQGARGEFPEAGVGGGEEVQVEAPFEVGEAEDHVFASGVSLALGGLGCGGDGRGGGSVSVAVGEGGGFRSDNAEDDEVAVEGWGEGVAGGFDGGEEGGNGEDVVSGEGAG